MPHDGLKSLGVRGNVSRVDGWNNDADIGDFRGVATVAPDDSQNFRADTLCVLQSSHQIGADILFDITAADRQNQNGIALLQAVVPAPSPGVALAIVSIAGTDVVRGPKS